LLQEDQTPTRFFEQTRGSNLVSLVKIEDEMQDKKLMHDVIKITAGQTSSHVLQVVL
jgi:hypothetical protein